MKPAPFEYHAPSTVDEAVGLLQEHGEDAKVLAGGQSLIPLLALRLTRFDHLVDLNRVAALDGIRRDGDTLRVGAMTRQSVAERASEVAGAVPLLHRALPLIGHFQIRNRGTVGGSTAHADPASELPAVALALDAELVATGPGGTRSIAAREFFVSTWTTVLEPDEILTEIRYPVWGARSGFAVEEFARRHGDFAIAGVACATHLDEAGKVARAGLALFGMGPTPIRADAAEQALLGRSPDELDLAAVAAEAVAGTSPNEDLHGSPAYRRRVAAHLTEIALRNALKEAAGG